jgi:hypothetical protein
MTTSPRTTSPRITSPRTTSSRTTSQGSRAESATRVEAATDRISVETWTRAGDRMHGLDDLTRPDPTLICRRHVHALLLDMRMRPCRADDRPACGLSPASTALRPLLRHWLDRGASRVSKRFSGLHPIGLGFDRFSRPGRRTRDCDAVASTVDPSSRAAFRTTSSGAPARRIRGHGVPALHVDRELEPPRGSLKSPER